jgi:hypothetical protein
MFENAARPSVDGVSYRGMCGCSSSTDTFKCHTPHNESDVSEQDCDSKAGMVRWNGTCHLLYTKGPCSIGQWLVPVREGRQWYEQNGLKKQLKAICECRPGYKPVQIIARRDIETGSDIHAEQCQPPSVALARFLNQNYYAQH